MGGKPRILSEALATRRATRQRFGAVRKELARSRRTLNAAIHRLDKIDAKIAKSMKLSAKAVATKKADSSPPPTRSELVALLRFHNGNISEIARSFGKARVQIRRWAAAFKIELDDYR